MKGRNKIIAERKIVLKNKKSKSFSSLNLTPSIIVKSNSCLHTSEDDDNDQSSFDINNPQIKRVSLLYDEDFNKDY